MSCIIRKKKGSGFIYCNESGKIIKDKEFLEYVKTLRIPPGYHDVYINTNRDGKVLALGLDEKNRARYSI
jgi:DNA topoisomerase-1